METNTFEPMELPDRRRARRVASLCAFATVMTHVIAYTMTIAASFLLRDSTLSEQAANNLNLIFNTVISDLIAMPLCWLIFLRRLPRNEALSPDAPDRTPLRFGTLLFFFPCVYALAAAGSMTGQLIGLLIGKGLTNIAADVILSVNPLVTLLCASIIAPVAEELFFRKALIDRLSQFHPMDAILLSALLFGLVHSNLTQFLYAFPIGVLFGIIYWRTKNIGYTILLHVFMNTVGGVAPQIMTMFTQGEGESLAAMLGALVSMLFASLMLGLVVVGIVFLIRYRKRFLPIESPLPRCRKPFYLNVGWFVACTVFVGMFLAVELLK
ncbi:MAG: CPBP family intramembrane metalloprotease [Clostridia bacterium]|nr:CPBP family intramembrane metalloprotease [Clostridia bacterium]